MQHSFANPARPAPTAARSPWLGAALAALLLGSSAACRFEPGAAEPDRDVEPVQVQAGDAPPGQHAAAYAAAGSLNATHYGIVQGWLAQHGLMGERYDSIAALADTDAGAARYVACHERSRAPDGAVTRLELLSLCLRRDAGTGAETHAANTAGTRVPTRAGSDTGSGVEALAEND